MARTESIFDELLPQGEMLATESKQSAANISLDNIDQSIEALQEISARLATLASMANSGQPALRIIPISGSTIAISSGTVTALTNLGTFPAFLAGVAMGNANAIQSNINNVAV